MTITDFFTKLINNELSSGCNISVSSSEIVERVEISETPVAAATQVSPVCNILELTANIGRCIHYRLKIDDDTIFSSTSQQNGLLILMQNASKTKLHLPTLSQSGRINRKQKLRFDLVDWIHSHGGGWSSQSYANTQGKEFINNLTETIWYIDMRDHQKLENRNYHIPELFLEFFGRADPGSYRESQKSFDANELNLHCQILAPYTTSSWMLNTNFNWLRDAFDSFIVTISDYIGFLRRQRNITAVNHTSEVPIRSIDQAATIKIHNQNIWIMPVDKTKYFHLEQLLINLPIWKPVDIEEYLPNDPV
jgi:hypothetical protein